MFQPYIAKDRQFQDMTFDFHIANEVGKEWYDGGQDQHMPERQWCRERLKTGMTVVDCGAHHGMMSVIFAKAVGKSGRVFAYEALPSNADVIQANALLNDLDNIIVRPVGVGAKNGSAGIEKNQGNVVVQRGADLARRSPLQMIRQLFRPPAPAAVVREEIAVVSLDEDLPQDTNVDFLKIDVEGFEAEAIDGMRKTLAQRPIVDLEIHNFLSDEPRSDLQKLADALSGYHFTALGEIFGQMKDMGTSFDIEYLLGFKNPHVFCEPIG